MIKPNYHQNPFVQTPAEFYLKIPDGYSEWPIKWWREVIQNASDAKATEVQLDCRRNNDGTWVASCEDNGRGMDERTLIDKFFAMGGTSKTGEETIGGFGIAKGLIAFAWHRWEIHTRDLIVKGRVNYYDAPKRTAMRVGTRVTAWMDVGYDRHTTPEAAMELLQRSNVTGIKFFINGERFTPRLRPGAPIKDGATGQEAELELGLLEGAEGHRVRVAVPIHYNKSTKSGEVYVRAAGLYMFTQANLWEPDLGTITVEIPGSVSRQVLADNRDSFRDNRIGQQLNLLTKEVAVEGERALKHKSKLIDRSWNIAGLMSVDNERSATASVLDAMAPVDPGELLEIGKQEAQEIIRQAMIAVKLEQDRVDRIVQYGSEGQAEKRMPITPEIITAIFASLIPGTPTPETTAQQLIWTPAYRLLNNQEGYTVPKQFYPATMSPTVELLLKTWAEACRWVFIQLGYPARYGVGFVFDAEVGAIYSPDLMGVKWLLLNPLADGFGRKRLFSKGSRDNLKWIYSSAIHEATHMANNISQHNVAFSYATAHNVATCADGFNTLIRIANAIVTDKEAREGVAKKRREIRVGEEPELVLDRGPEEVEDRVPTSRAPDEQAMKTFAYNLGLSWGQQRPDDPRSGEELWGASGTGAKAFIKKVKYKPDFLRGLQGGRGR